jgi:flavin-dependent dehydrogenase
MQLDRSQFAQTNVYPVILGAGLTGIAISRALSTAGITHVLVGGEPGDTPRLGESLNAEGSLEIARQFPDLTRFFLPKRRQAIFFGGHTIRFDSVQFASGRPYYSLLGYPDTVQLLHVDRVGFDRAAFEAASSADPCIQVSDRAVAVQYDAATDRITSLQLAAGESIVPSYVFDATNHACFVARDIGVGVTRIGRTRRVAFAHYTGTSAASSVPGWNGTTSLLRLDLRKDPVDGIAWLIPLGTYASMGISVDPETTGADSGLLLDSVEKAFLRRGLDVRGTFPTRGAAVDFRYEHYNHERCYGRNWLLAGLSCCQVWFPSAAGVATGLVAARLAPAALRSPAEAGAVYQGYIDEVATVHSGLDWLVRDDPWSVTIEELRVRSWAMVGGNITRLADYLLLGSVPDELSNRIGPLRLFEGDRRMASPVRIETAPSQAQATRLFSAGPVPDPWTDAPIAVPVLIRPTGLQGPAAILGLVDMLSGKRDVKNSADLVTDNVQLTIDHFQLQGVAAWMAWASLLRGSVRVTNLELVPGSLSASGADWLLGGQWQGVLGGQPSVSPQFSVTFTMSGDKVSAIQMQRADFTFVTGDAILPRAAFAAVVGQMLSPQAQPHQ